MKCDYCKNKLIELDTCKFCHFEPEDYYVKDDFDIVNLDKDYEWSHLQIRNRLHAKGLPCTFVDISWDYNLVLLLGCNVFSNKIAEVLGVHRECVYNWDDQALIIINLYQEKCIRKKEYEDELKNDISIDYEMTKKIFSKKKE